MVCYGSLFVYDFIPENLISGKILELGATNKYYDVPAQLVSKHKEKFLSDNYLGLDYDPPGNTNLNVIKQDLFTFKPDIQFDTILAIDIIEHISLESWGSFFERVKLWLKPKGNLILSTPYNETCIYPHPYNHVVFGITGKTFIAFLPNARIQTVSHPNLFRGEGENLFRCLLRYIKRRITNHYFVKYKLIVIYQKDEDQTI